MTDNSNHDTPAVIARHLLRSRGRGALGTSLDGGPFVSLVALATDSDAAPLLLLSDLAQHTHNLVADPRVSLLVEKGVAQGDPLAQSRLTLLGRAERHDDPAALARFTARHPSSAVYSGFADFHLYRIVLERGHLVAGFGRIAWIERQDLLGPQSTQVAAAEAGIVAHMNTDHADAVALYAERLLGLGGKDWRMIGIDPEGIDLHCGDDAGGEWVRLAFPEPIADLAAARRALIELVRIARSRR
jgi:putative heme iron utilization protein